MTGQLLPHNLQLVYDWMVEIVLSSSYIQADESLIKVLQGSKKGTHQGYMWVYHSPPDNIVFFDYQKGRDQSGPKKLLQSFKGIVQADGYEVYDTTAKALNLTLSGCMAHARRKFDEALSNDKARAEIMITIIRQLYAIERDIKDKTPEEIYLIRQIQSVPVLEKMEKWMKQQLYSVTPSSPIGIAISYSIARWDKLRLYTEFGYLLIDNNQVENAIRPLALGRKNYLFAGSHQSAQRIAMMMYTITSTCKKLDINPQQYMEYLLTELPYAEQTTLMTCCHRIIKPIFLI